MSKQSRFGRGRGSSPVQDLGSQMVVHYGQNEMKNYLTNNPLVFQHCIKLAGSNNPSKSPLSRCGGSNSRYPSGEVREQIVSQTSYRSGTSALPNIYTPMVQKRDKKTALNLIARQSDNFVRASDYRMGSSAERVKSARRETTPRQSSNGTLQQAATEL